MADSQFKYAILGAGRAAAHFTYYFDLLNIPYSRWDRSLESTPGPLLSKVLSDCTHALLLVSDSAIEPLAKQAQALELRLNRSRPILWVHCSGSLFTPLAWGCHPLISFSKDRSYELSVYRTIHFVVDQSAPSFSTLLPGLQNPSSRIAPELKPLYHSLCVLSGNFSVLLWKKLLDELELKFSIPRQAALPYLRTVSENIQINPRTAFTGPLARGDQTTIDRNLLALNGDPYKEVYLSFVKAYTSPTRTHEMESHHERH